MKTLITAHSGADHTEENSVGFLRHAFVTAADAVEVDVRMVAGELVLAHDGVEETGKCDRGTGTLTHFSSGSVEPSESAEKCVSVPVPLSHFSVTLKQAFTMLQEDRSGKRINCDLKEHGLERPVYDLAVEAGVAERILYTGSVGVERMRAEGLLGKVEVYLNIEEAVPTLRTMWEAGDRCEELRGRSECPPVTSNKRTVPLTHYYKQACEVCVDAGIRVLNVPKEIVDETFCEILKEYGVQASVWTVDDVEEAQRFARWPQVVNITTRNVAEMTKGTGPNVTLGSR